MKGETGKPPSLKNYKLTVEYDGTEFRGWQIQKQNERTVQGELEKVCARIFQHKANVIGSGRTDSGAHALGQVAHFKAQTKLSPQEIQKAFNALLPEDIVIHAVRAVDSTFHAQLSATGKTYRYTILNRPYRTAQTRRTSYFYPYKLNVAAMRREARDLIGCRDFRSFQASDSLREDKSTVRRVKAVRLRRAKDCIYFEITANGFLYKMVRNIVGTLLEVGNGRLPPGSIQRILRLKNRTKAGATAPAHGLCLMKVDY